MSDIVVLKQKAINLNGQLKRSRLFKRIGLKFKLKKLLDEIEYQEGRLQFANRPYSLPPAILHVPGQEKADHNLACRCGCWKMIRAMHGIGR